MNFNKITIWDISLIKLSVMCATLFLISIWSGFANWVINTHWAIFLVLSVALSIKPIMTVFKK